MWVAEDETSSMFEGAYSYVWFAEGVSENVSRSQIFDVDAGTHDFHLMVETLASIGVYRPQLVLMFVPE